MRDDSCEAMDNTDVREIERLQLICPPAGTGIWLDAGVIDTRGCDVRLHDDSHIDAACQASVRRRLRHPPFTSSPIGGEAMRRIGAL